VARLQARARRLAARGKWEVEVKGGVRRWCVLVSGCFAVLECLGVGGREGGGGEGGE
jgi:hypothetical protein